jgi:hypothetical protein
MQSHELGVAQFGHSESHVQIQWQVRVPRVDTDPIVFTGFTGFGDHTVALHHMRLGSCLIDRLLEQSDVVHNAPAHIVHFEAQSQPTHNLIHDIVL